MTQEHRHWPVGLMALGIMLLIYGSVEFGFTYPAYVELQDQYANLAGCTDALCIAERTALSQGIERVEITLFIRTLIIVAGAISIAVAWPGRVRPVAETL